MIGLPVQIVETRTHLIPKFLIDVQPLDIDRPIMAVVFDIILNHAATSAIIYRATSHGPIGARQVALGHRLVRTA